MIVILGHTGFIGASLLRHLEGGGRQVIGLSRHECDLTSLEDVKKRLGELTEPFDLVNCAVLNRDKCGNFDSFEINCRMLHNLVKALPSGKCRSFIHLSSVDVYGRKPLLPLNELTLPAPHDYYALAKLTGENLLRIGLDADCHLAILRLPGVYGVSDGGNSVIGRLVKNILTGRPITLAGQGLIRRDPLAVIDLFWIVEQLLESPRKLLVNIATGCSYSLLEMVNIIAEIGSVEPEIVFADDPHGPANGDLLFDVSALGKKFPGFAPQSLRKGITNYIIGMRNMGAS